MVSLAGVFSVEYAPKKKVMRSHEAIAGAYMPPNPAPAHVQA